MVGVDVELSKQAQQDDGGTGLDVVGDQLACMPSPCGEVGKCEGDVLGVPQCRCDGKPRKWGAESAGSLGAEPVEDLSEVFP